jgi:predicted dehydrogenase
MSIPILKGGVIGFGNIGQDLTAYLNRRKTGEARIVAACDIAQPQLDLAKNEYGLVTTPNAHELVNMELDFVVISSANAAHADQVVLAAAASKHIFCEKPIALSLAEADRMIEAVETAGVITVVNYSLRYIDGYLKFKEMAAAGRLGQILCIWHFMTRGFGLYSAGARHWAILKPELSGGWTIHHACHSLDFLYWVNGPMATAYCTSHSTAPQPASEEVLLGNLTFGNGAMGMVGDSTCCIREHHTGIIGSKGSLLMTGEHEQTVMRLHLEGEKEERLLPAVDSKRPGGGMDHFLDCIRQDKPSPNSLSEARPSLAAALAMQESARTGQVVPIDKKN